MLSVVIGHHRVNKLIINRLVNVSRNRPHPWSTLHSYISWDSLTDKSYNARLLPPNPYPTAEVSGSRRPPVADIIDLFRPDENGQVQCRKSTCLFPAFAQYLTDGFIRTQISNIRGEVNRRRTTSNHEIDQSPLYGRNKAQTDALRRRDERLGKRGQLKSQLIGEEEYPLFLYRDDGSLNPEFADDDGHPILDPPLGLDHVSPEGKRTLFAVGGDRANATPQVTMMNVLFLREHNRLAKMLEADNPHWDDERIFQTARNIVIVMFIKIVVEEYINHISTSSFDLKADPSVAWGADWNRPNWMTIEFSLLYRWHSLVPEKLQWGETLHSGDSLLLNNSLILEDGLAKAFAEISANNATQLGLKNSASFLLHAEAKAIEQYRINDVDSYNAYRREMGLDEARDFDALVGDGDNVAERQRRSALATQLAEIYGHVDNVDFYVGLFAEPVNEHGPLPELLMSMVAMDAFSQALTNPLLSEHVYGNNENRKLTFTQIGLDEIERTGNLRQILIRNSAGLGVRFVGMTRQDWQSR